MTHHEVILNNLIGLITNCQFKVSPSTHHQMDNQGVDPSASPLGCNDPTNHVTDYVLFIGDSAVVVSSSSFVSSQLGVVYLEGSVVSLVSNVFAPVSTVVYPAYPTFAKNIYSSNTDLAYVDEEYEMKDFFLVIKIYLCLY